MDLDRDLDNRRRNRISSDPRGSKGACLKAVSRFNSNSQQITETRPISFRRGGFEAGVLRDLLFKKDLP
jgi:hypothetical protein